MTKEPRTHILLKIRFLKCQWLSIRELQGTGALWGFSFWELVYHHFAHLNSAFQPQSVSIDLFQPDIPPLIWAVLMVSEGELSTTGTLRIWVTVTLNSKHRGREHSFGDRELGSLSQELGQCGVTPTSSFPSTEWDRDFWRAFQGFARSDVRAKGRLNSFTTSQHVLPKNFY